jgi:RHS repeat-associated protein
MVSRMCFVRADHIGRPVFATNATGVKVWTATYNPFGGVYVSTGSPPAARFPGQWFQSESGLHQNWMRDYDPTTGRYLQADPLGLVDGASVYGYVKQNPGRWVDPRGESFFPESFWPTLCSLFPIQCISLTPRTTPQVCPAVDDPDLLIPLILNSVGWAGIEGVSPHPDGPVQGGNKQQGIKPGGSQQAEEDFDAATGGQSYPIGDGKRRGTGPNGENIIYDPESTGGPSGTDGGIPTIHVDGNKLRYP